MWYYTCIMYYTCTMLEGWESQQENFIASSHCSPNVMWKETKEAYLVPKANDSLLPAEVPQPVAKIAICSYRDNLAISSAA